MSSDIAVRLNALLIDAGLQPVSSTTANQFADYLALILRWNARTNLTAIRDEEGILSRHFVESIVCARALPAGIGTLLDFGSGAGLPGIPIALCRPAIRVTLAESQNRKAAFLREAIRILALSVDVHAGRAETLLDKKANFDCVTMRAVDKTHEAVKQAAHLVAPGGWLVLMTTGSERAPLELAAGPEFHWPQTVPLPGEERQLALGQRGV